MKYTKLNLDKYKGYSKTKHKSSFFILLMLSCLAINSCHNNISIPHSILPSQNEFQNSFIRIEQLQQTDIPLDASIFSVQENYLLYIRHRESISSESDNISLYYYQYDTKENRYLGKISLPSMYAEPAVQIEDSLYFLGGLNGQENGICKVNLETYELEQIYETDASAFFPRLNKYGNQLLLLNITSDQNECNTYHLELLNPNGTDRSIIAERNASSEAGSYISCIDTDEKYIYAFEECIHMSKRTYQILRFEPNGEADSFQVDLSELIEVDTNGLSNDVIMYMEKIGDYFVLQTLNGRLYLLMMTDDSIQTTEIDSQFYRSVPGGYSFLTDINPNTNNLYILSQNTDTKIYLFNPRMANFREINLPENEKLYFCSGYGSKVLVQKQYDSPFYLLSLPS